MLRTFAIFLVTASSALAGEYAVLASGARLHADRHEVEGPKVTLYSGAGSTEMDAASIVRFEQDDSAPPAPGHPTAPPANAIDVRQLVDNAARKYGLPPAFVHAVVAAESGYRQTAVSRKGAVGLMQLMPSTARDFGADPNIAAENVDAGARYLRDLLVKYDRKAYHALAAYNAGPAAVDRYHGVPPYRETLAYIRNVLRNWQKP